MRASERVTGQSFHHRTLQGLSGKVKFFFLSDIKKNLKITINTLEGVRPRDEISEIEASLGTQSLLSQQRQQGHLEFLLECQLLVDGRPLTTSLQTRYRHFTGNGDRRGTTAKLARSQGDTERIDWHETLVFPINYNDLSASDHRSCILKLQLWDLSPASETRKGKVERKSKMADENSYSSWYRAGRKLVGEGDIRLISDQRVLEMGQRRVILRPLGEKTIDPNVEEEVMREALAEARYVAAAKGLRNSGEFSSRGGDLKWLSKLESYRLQSMRNFSPQPHSPSSISTFTRKLRGESTKFSHPVLTISLPEFPYPVVAWHSAAADPVSQGLRDSIGSTLAPLLPLNSNNRLVAVHDLGMEKTNPVELKFQKLAKSFGQHTTWFQAKPNARERAALGRLIKEPLHMREVKAHDHELLWKFRLRLTTMKNTITRFLRAVDFSDADERQEAMRMLPLWEKEKTVSSEDALELLSEDFLDPDIRKFAVRQLEEENNQEIENYLMLLVQALQYEQKYPSPLSKFICKRSAQKLSMANAVNWYLTVEAAENPRMYSGVLSDFREVYLNATAEGKQWKADIELQMNMVDNLRSLCKMVSTKGGKQSRRIENLRSALKPGGKFASLTKFERPVRFPLDPDVLLTGLVPEKSTVFASNAFPVLLAFQRHESNELVRVIFKDGDDLRQDQLIMQLVKLMDKRLKKQGLDLEIISFQVQGWSANDGVVEFVPGCSTVASVIDEWKDISKFLQEHNPKQKQINVALNNWVKSSAGFSVLTYILAIGDRHLDNILLTKDGHMLHIDFGYIFGRDPKPFPPKVKFTKDMMDAMGGKEFEEQFYEKSCISYNLLRRDACLILNLIYLTGEWAGNKKDNLACIRSRLLLDKDDEEAAKDYKLLVHKVMHSGFEAFKDNIHTIATNLKK